MNRGLRALLSLFGLIPMLAGLSVAGPAEAAVAPAKTAAVVDGWAGGGPAGIRKPDGKDREKPKRVTPAEREAAAARAARRGSTLPAPSAAGPRTTAAGTVPHYYGPYPNYANSPLPTVTGAVISVGNPLVGRAYATDFATPPGEQAPVLVVVPTALPDGLVQAFQTFNQTSPGGSPNPSAGNVFHAYVLRPTGTANEYRILFDSGALTVPAATDPAGEVATFPVPAVAVRAGDVAAFYGQGIPVDTGAGSDTLSFPAPAAPLADTTITLGSAAYPVHPEARTYSFATSVVDLSGNNPVVTGGIRKFVDGLPGLGSAGANNLGQYIPVAVPDTTTFPGSDYYEIGLVQYREKVHSDLSPTLLRGYVQLSTEVVPGARVALANANLDGSSTPVTDGQGPVYAVDRPHQLGPLISATKDRPVRIKFRNLLPTGAGGNLFIPVDTTVMGSGAGPQMGGMEEPDPQNPMCGGTPKPAGCFAENRATLHLHGGVTPWISDGTPHQWITPAGEDTAYPKGVSVRNVPDMPDPGPGAQTFFYTNQQSARMMFYHDHAWGITRLNVYAGEAAGYVIADQAEQALIDAGILPGATDTLPLIIQDKTFVPGAAQLAAEDPTWDTARWGGEGSLWVPHVYMPAQNPGDTSGVNQFGRWAYGPWFWPPTNGTAHGPIPNPYYDPNCDTDTGAWCEPPLIPGTPNISMGMESFNDTPLVNGTAYPAVTIDPKAYRLRVLNAANDRFWNLQFYQADATGTEVALKPAEVEAAQTDPTVFPTPDLSRSPAGPSWIQIGTEGGFLPAPVVVPNQPITWVTDPTVFNAGNVDKHALLLAPAERADTVVDFSQYAGKTLILYNDAPAAFPARDPRYDYYTGGPSLVDTGGAPSTLPGYGPNTRTIMQIKVADKPAAPAYDLARLQAAFAHNANNTGVFESSQDPIIVGQGAYNSAYGSTFRNTAPRDGFVRITDTSLTFNTLLGQGAAQTMTIPLQPKAIQDEMGEAFDPEYGRMSGNLGLEAPNAQAGQQNLILYPFVNPSSENLKGVDLPPGASVTPIARADDGTQLWKITHNGVDTHPIHFHLFHVQLINRVGWDGIIRKPEPSELGWKDTLRVSPLEDTIVALRPIIPKTPFGVEDSVRPLNPATPIGSPAGFNSTDANGNPITPPITNQLVSFGWEYVWHCHILSHEEMDMMRPISVTVPKTLPQPPVVTYTRNGGVVLAWTDGTPVTADLGASWGSPANEVGYRIERAPVDAAGTAGAYAQIGTALANATTFTDPDAGATTQYSYRVTAYNAAGGSTSTEILAGPAGTASPTGPTALAATLTTGVRLVWRDNATTESGFVVERATGTGGFTPIATPSAQTAGGNVVYLDTTVQPETTYLYRVKAVNGGGSSTYTGPISVTTPPPPAAPSNLAGSASLGTGNTAIVNLNWTDNSVNEFRFIVQRSTSPTFPTATTYNVPANTPAWEQTGVPRNRTFYYRVRALNAGGTSDWSNVITVTTP
jgi:FtsP/CotA-like multicopper oxidase with cupredoxin domain